MNDSKAWEDAQEFIFVQSEWCIRNKKPKEKNDKIYRRIEKGN